MEQPQTLQCTLKRLTGQLELRMEGTRHAARPASHNLHSSHLSGWACQTAQAPGTAAASHVSAWHVAIIALQAGKAIPAMPHGIGQMSLHPCMGQQSEGFTLHPASLDALTHTAAAMAEHVGSSKFPGEINAICLAVHMKEIKSLSWSQMTTFSQVPGQWPSMITFNDDSILRRKMIRGPSKSCSRNRGCTKDSSRQFV